MYEIDQLLAVLVIVGVLAPASLATAEPAPSVVCTFNDSRFTEISGMTLSLALPAVAGGPNNVVNTSPTSDGTHLHRASVQVTSTGAKSVTSSNLAIATPHDCTGCEGIAVAFQALIVTGGSSTISPTNAAVAVNTNCTSCGAFAYAYQYVVTADRGLEE